MQTFLSKGRIPPLFIVVLFVMEKLSKDPIVEAIFEVRFEPNDPSTGQMFSGLMYSELRDTYPRVETLNTSQIPFEIRSKDPNLRYSVDQRFRGDTPYLVSVGSRVLAIACGKPYQHWENFKPKVAEVLRLLKEVDYVKEVERIGLRYINFLPLEGSLKDQFDQLDVSSTLGNYNLTEYTTQIRTEIPGERFLSTVNISNNASTSLDREALRGVILDIDTICNNVPGNFLDDFDSLLEEAHDIEGEVFRASLTKQTMERLR